MSDPKTITEIKSDKTDEVLEDLFSIKESYLEKAANYFEEAAKLAREITDKPTEARLLSKLGEVYVKLDNVTDAIKNYQNSRKIFNSIGDRKNELKILMDLGKVQKVTNKVKDSRESYQQAAELASNTGELTAEETCYGELGKHHLKSNELSEAVNWFEKAINLSKRLNNKRTEAKWMNYLGQCSDINGDFDKAISFFEKSVDLASSVADKKVEAKGFAFLGSTYFKKDELTKATESLEQAIKIIGEIKQKEEQASYLGLVADVYFASGDLENAKENYEKSARALKSSEDKRAFELQLGKVGKAYYEMEQYDKAAKHLTKAATLAEEIDKDHAMEWFGKLAEAETKLNQYEQAIEHFKKATELARNRKNKEKQAMYHLGLGKIYEEMDDPTNASSEFNKALKLAEGNIEVRLALGGVQFDLAKYDKALTHFNEAQKLAERIGDNGSELQSFKEQANAYIALGKPDQAVNAYKAALKIAKKIEDNILRNKEVEIQLGNLGEVYYNIGDYNSATKHFKEALDKARENNLRSFEGRWTGSLGNIAYSEGNFTQAIDRYEEALKIVKGLGIKKEEARWLTKLASVHEKQGNLNQAIEFNEKAWSKHSNLDKDLEGEILTNLSTEYLAIGDYNKVIKYCNDALKIAETLSQTVQKGVLHSNLGKAYFAKNKITNAINSFEIALDIAKTQKNDQDQLNFLVKLGKCYIKTDDQKSKDYFKKAKGITSKIGDKLLEESLYGDIAEAYLEVDHFDLAKDNINLAIKMADTPSSKAKWRIKLGDIYFKEEKFKESLNEYNDCLNYVKEMSNDIVGELYGKIGTTIQETSSTKGQLKEAVEYLEKAISSAEEHGNKINLCKWKTVAGSIYLDLERWDKARVTIESALIIAKEVKDMKCERINYSNLSKLEKLTQTPD